MISTNPLLLLRAYLPRHFERCSWLSLYSVNFVMHKTYYWVVETDNEIDEYIAAASPTSNEEWESEVREKRRPKLSVCTVPGAGC